MKETFKIINELKEMGLIRDYALGGATAVLFYAEPRNTRDVDFFVFFPEQGPLIDLRPLYGTLEKKGYPPRDEGIMIENVLVQFIPAPTPLVEEAIRNAVTHDYEDVPIRVFSVEHLMAIMLETNRPKDRERLASLLEEKVRFNKTKLLKILRAHKLIAIWEKFCDKKT